MKIDVRTCHRCFAPIHRGEEVKGCTRCGRVSSTIGYDRAVAVEREELAKLLSRAIRYESKMQIYLTRAMA